MNDKKMNDWNWYDWNWYLKKITTETEYWKKDPKKMNDWSWYFNNWLKIKNDSPWIQASQLPYQNDSEIKITDKEMVQNVSDRLDDRGFFDDCIDWLLKMSPRKMMSFIRFLYSGNSNSRINYTMICKAVYNMEFRASEAVEKRMILGETNEWVRKYFEDFPFGK